MQLNLDVKTALQKKENNEYPITFELERHDCDRNSFTSKPILAILLYSWEKYFTELFPTWRSQQPVLNFSHISIKLKNRKKGFMLFFLLPSVLFIIFCCSSGKNRKLFLLKTFSVY